MINWIENLLFFLLGAALLLSVVGLWLTRITPCADRWNKRFFCVFFIVLMASTFSGVAEMILYFVSAPMALIQAVLFLESLLITLPMLMLTVFLLHSGGENPRGSRLFHIALGLWAVYIAMLVSSIFLDGFLKITPDLQYSRGPLYPLIPLPMTIVMLLNLYGVIRRRQRLSRKIFLSFLIVILAMTVALLVHLFIDAFLLIDINVVFFGLVMYSLVMSDQIERDMRHQREIANQRSSIMVLQMRPHFIYNTLMSIYSLCNLDPQKARAVTMDFTEYLRKNFNAVASSDNIPFSEELEHTRAYLAVEKAQHEDMLLVEYDVQFAQFRLPPLILQPIAENAVKHGMNPYTGPLHVTIRTYRGNAASVIVVEDDGPGFDPAEQSEACTALTNIRQRLEWMCGGSLEIAPRDGGGTAVTVAIPDSSPKK